MRMMSQLKFCLFVIFHNVITPGPKIVVAGVLGFLPGIFALGSSRDKSISFHIMFSEQKQTNSRLFLDHPIYSSNRKTTAKGRKRTWKQLSMSSSSGLFLGFFIGVVFVMSCKVNFYAVLISLALDSCSLRI